MQLPRLVDAGCVEPLACGLQAFEQLRLVEHLRSIVAVLLRQAARLHVVGATGVGRHAGEQLQPSEQLPLPLVSLARLQARAACRAAAAGVAPGRRHQVEQVQASEIAAGRRTWSSRCRPSGCGCRRCA